MTEAIADTGGAKSLIDVRSAQKMGLPVTLAQDREFGTFYGPGSVERAYAGIVAVPVPVRFSADVVLYIRELKVIQHSEPIMLIGVDVLCSGHLGWDFRGIGPGHDGRGFISFACGRKNRTVPLLRAPHMMNLGQPAAQLLPPPPQPPAYMARGPRTPAAPSPAATSTG